MKTTYRVNALVFRNRSDAFVVFLKVARSHVVTGLGKWDSLKMWHCMILLGNK